ncbi:MAG: amidohydrolase family protein [Bacteroidia bacterium]|nr:amidohydrolase family protein [Bacteroidia bacterium]
MRKFSAHRIYPVSGPPISYGIIETADDGTILNIRSTGGQPVEEAGLEFFSGIIIPGLVNAHCHLEFSHLAGLIPQHTGIAGFVSAIGKIRESDPEKIQMAATEADRKMFREGISAVGDVSNTGITLPVKKISRIRYHTFIEVFGLNPETAVVRFDQALQLAKSFHDASLPHSITPHAPYSVGVDLWELLTREKRLTGRISIHHDESPDERELLDHRTGVMADLFGQAGFDLTRIPLEAPDIFKLLGRYLPYATWILVHNTVTDLFQANSCPKDAVYWVLCPRSNQYIENLLPDIERFAASGLTVCLGTDSLASNWNLSVLDEMKTIMEATPGISFDTVLQWATLNGACALGMEQYLGTIEKGKNPGLVNIPVFDWNNNRLSADSKSYRLI